MATVHHLQTIFEELDYLDDGYQDGVVSHVGLRRIILETPEVENELGATFTRALLAHAEQNLYGRLTFEEYILMARDIVAYSQSRGYPATNQQINRQTNYIKTPRQTIHNAAVKLAIPASERDDRVAYLDEYSCKPPPLFLLLITLSQIGVFIWHVILLSNNGVTVGPNGPPYITGPLIFNPNKKWEVWRFLSYMFVHSGYFHIVFNIIVQLVLGIPLEMVHRWWRILLIYLCGVIAGSLATSITDPSVYLAGASGGVYSLITAHLANVIFNWTEMEFAGLRLFLFLLLIGVDLGVAVYYRYMNVSTQVGYVAHLGGAAVGLLLGIVVLRNLRVKSWERVVWWISLLVFLGLFLTGIVWNAVLIGYNRQS